MELQLQVDPANGNIAFARARERIKLLQVQRARTIEAARETSAWRSLVSTIQDKTRIPVVSNFNINRIYEPRDVIVAAERAAINYEEKGSVLHNPFRALARSIGDNHTCMEMFLEFIPDSEYTSIICGALTLLLTAAASVSKARSSIIECLAGLNGKFQDSEDWLQLYNNEADYVRLWDAAENMYVAILQASQRMICWLDESAWKHFKGSMKLGGGYTDAIKAQTKGLIDEQAAAFEAVVNYCLHLRVAKTYDTVTETDSKVDKLLEQGVELERARIEESQLHERRANIMIGSQKEVESGLLKLLQGMQKMLDDQAAQHASVQAKMEADAIAMRAQMDDLRQAVQKQGPPKVILKSSEILGVLAVPYRSSTIDLEHVRNLGTLLNAGYQRRTASILRDPMFHDWLTGPESGVLLLNGMDLDSHCPVSATTYCVARVNDALYAEQVAISLNFLCAQHMTPGDALFGPVGLLRSVCAQLLQAAPVELKLTLDDRRLIDDTAQNNVVALTSLFRMLLVELAKKVGRICVVVMIDDVSMMEDDAGMSELFSLVVQQLVSICVEIKSLTNPIILKMLFASRTVSSKVDRQFRESETLTMQPYVQSEMAGPLPAMR